MGTPALPLSDVVDVAISVSPQLPATPTFNQGAIVGSSAVIPSVAGTAPLRMRLYSSLAGMVADGFSISEPEYIAASLYFANGATLLWVGRQDLTALQTVIIHSGNAGTGYAVNDIVTVVQGGGSLGQVKITAVTGGVPTAVAVVSGSQGTGYSLGTALATTGGTGTGLEVDITAIGETCLQAVQACRLASPNWWSIVALNATDTDSIAIGEWAQSQAPQCMYMYTTSSTDVLNNVTGNVLATLKAGNYSRAFGVYSTTQSGLYPNNIYAAVAAMGKAMGLNTGLANSFFTMKFKTLTGIFPELWTESTKAIVENNNGNVYVNYGNAYTWLEQGVVADGQFFDEILNLDMLASDYQYSVIDVLISNPSVAQDELGQTQIINAIDSANGRAATRGFLAGGVWEGVTILNLTTGDPIPLGYKTQSPPYTTQSPSDRQARKSVPVYVAIIEAGAIHSVLIGVYVQR
jgi:hypothetical protein